MAVKIRLQKLGRTDIRFFRIVVADESEKRNGKVIDYIGTVDRSVKPPKIIINAQKVKEWMGKGARPTPSAEKLLTGQKT